VLCSSLFLLYFTLNSFWILYEGVPCEAIGVNEGAIPDERLKVQGMKVIQRLLMLYLCFLDIPLLIKLSEILEMRYE
jgi:hypothetical protein